MPRIFLFHAELNFPIKYRYVNEQQFFFKIYILKLNLKFTIIHLTNVLFDMRLLNNNFNFVECYGF